MTHYIFIDESGDLGLSGSKYLVLAALMIDDYAPLDRIIKNMRRNKFKKELKKANEIKANKSSNEIRIYMLNKLNRINSAKVLFVIFEKRKLTSKYLKKNKHKLYNYVAGHLAKNIYCDCDTEIRIDKSKGKQLLQMDFNRYFTKNLKSKYKVSIHHSHSHSWSGLQFADLLAWSCFNKFEYQNNRYIDQVKLEKEVYHVWDFKVQNQDVLRRAPQGTLTSWIYLLVYFININLYKLLDLPLIMKNGDSHETY